MNKVQCTAKINAQLRNALRSLHAQPGMTQEKLAEMLQITVRACSALENGKNGFSIFTATGLLSILNPVERRRLIDELCAIASTRLLENPRDATFAVDYLAAE